MKFTEHKYAQADYFVYDNGDSYLQSYNTQVCGVSGGWFWINGLYSTTTRKHISWYLRELRLPLSYYGAKQLLRDDQEMNIYTGELRGRKNVL